MHSTNQTIRSITPIVALAFVTPAPSTRAVVLPPGSGYPNQNTAEGDSALFSLTNGTDNTDSIDIESDKPPNELLTLARALRGGVDE